MYEPCETGLNIARDVCEIRGFRLSSEGNSSEEKRENLNARFPNGLTVSVHFRIYVSKSTEFFSPFDSNLYTVKISNVQRRLASIKYFYGTKLAQPGR